MQRTHPSRIAVLTSVIGYGVYFPALITSGQLREQGVDTRVFILEHLLSEAKREVFKKSRDSFRKNYNLAKLAAKFPVQYSDNLADGAVEALFAGWRAEGITHFLCFSGLWLDILARYRRLQPGLVVSCCRIDAGISPAWAVQEAHPDLVNHAYCFFSPAEGRINYLLNVPFAPGTLVPFDERPAAVLVHGGGWGLGGYAQRTRELAGTPFGRNLMIHAAAEYDGPQEGVRCFLNDPGWDPLEEAPGSDHGFPPFGEVTLAGEAPRYHRFHAHPGILSMIGRSRAILSKPGGMSLVDALVTETPLVYFEPMGVNEEGNIRICEALGVGLAYETWQESNFSPDLLREVHHNIKAAKRHIPEFIQSYLNHIPVPTL